MSILLTILVVAAPASTRLAPATAPVATETRRDPPAGDEPAARSLRRLRIGGHVALGLGAGLFGVMAAAARLHVETVARLEDREAALARGQRVSAALRDEVRRDLHGARLDRGVAIGAGVSAAACFALATGLLVLARGRSVARNRRLAVAPWWSTSGAGLQLRLRLP